VAPGEGIRGPWLWLARRSGIAMVSLVPKVWPWFGSGGVGTPKSKLDCGRRSAEGGSILDDGTGAGSSPEREGGGGASVGGGCRGGDAWGPALAGLAGGGRRRRGGSAAMAPPLQNSPASQALRPICIRTKRRKAMRVHTPARSSGQ